MKKLLIGFAAVALITLSPITEAQPSREAGRLSVGFPGWPGSAGEVGIASWYGEDFDGNPTASGEVFDMNGLTAAHPSLPLGTKVMVTNLRNKRSMVLKVNDRGPYVHGRLIDVSKEAAYRMGFMGSGLALVEVKVIRYPKRHTHRPGSRTLPAETE
jgi:peptidoglycan lytic transglycosylase